ncbi:unnamed protein product [Pelagomonas calceolata]|uniref:Uncharacterized protein n=1 Tax=Pelagomonas calceolata TaxID=35677 RepID=A0A8J2X0Y4_9STRA|nr:unnamed protein product [Pelagomonas calceolata]
MRRAAVLLGAILPVGSALRVARPAPQAVDRRAFAAALTTLIPGVANAALARDAPPPPGILENRDRGLNEKALIANDFYFRYDAYSKHGLTVRAASEDLADLGQALRKKDLNTASFLLDSGEKGKAPSSLRQASRKALLLADGLLISANSGSLGREVLVARYYINEFHYATERIADMLSGGRRTMATVHTRLIQYLTKLGGGPAPWAPANLAGTAALFGASAVCAGAYTLWGSSGVPGTHKSSLWQEATNAYLKFQGADPISYPEVGKPKF